MRENLSSGLQPRSDTNLAVQPQKMARGLKFSDLRTRFILSTMGKQWSLICAFVSKKAESRFSHDMAHMVYYEEKLCVNV